MRVRCQEIYIQGVSSIRRVFFKQLSGGVYKNRFFLEFFLLNSGAEVCKCCFWVFRLMGGFLSTSAKHRTVLKTCHGHNETTLVQNIKTIVGACCLLNFSCSACVKEGAGLLKSSRKYDTLDTREWSHPKPRRVQLRNQCFGGLGGVWSQV